MSDKPIYAVKDAAPLKLFKVVRKDIYETPVYIRAEDLEKALEYVQKGQGEYGKTTFKHAHDEGAWEATRCERKGKGRGRGSS